MNKTMINFAKEQIKIGLMKLNYKHRLFFKRMYSPKDLNKPITDIVDSIPIEKLSWALSQVENTLKKRNLI